MKKKSAKKKLCFVVVGIIVEDAEVVVKVDEVVVLVVDVVEYLTFTVITTASGDISIVIVSQPKEERMGSLMQMTQVEMNNSLELTTECCAVLPDLQNQGNVPWRMAPRSSGVLSVAIGENTSMLGITRETQ